MGARGRIRAGREIERETFRTTVICRCRKEIFSYRDWVAHLKKRHPRLYEAFRADGTLEEDRAVFRRAREIA